MSNIEQGISNVEETDRSKTDDPSKFEIPCSIFDISEMSNKGQGILNFEVNAKVIVATPDAGYGSTPFPVIFSEQ